jgi:hypothetical protein
MNQCIDIVVMMTRARRLHHVEFDEVVELASIIDENNHLRTNMLNCLSYRSGCPSELRKTYAYIYTRFHRDTDVAYMVHLPGVWLQLG